MRSDAFHSFSATPRFWGGALVALAVLTNLACVCGAAAAPAAARTAAPVAKQSEAHTCCRHTDSATGERPHAPAPAAPAHDGQDGCPHCGNGTLAVERSDRNDGPSLQPLDVGFGPNAAPADHSAGPSQRPLLEGFATPPASLPLRPTLLGLHCALNL